LLKPNKKQGYAMDENANNDNNEIDFGIHLNSLTESAASESADSGAGEDAPAASSETQPEETPDSYEAPDADPQKTENPGIDQVSGDIEGIKRQLKELKDSFEAKLKYDEHKNKVIDDLHQSLQDYRDGLLKKYLQRIFTDVIKIVDDARKLAGYYWNQPFCEENNKKLLQYLEEMAQELEEMFAWEGVETFNTEGEALDPTRQRVINKIETDDPEKNKKIAERLRPGYEWDGKIIRPEIVSIYIYNQENTLDSNEET